MYGSNSAALSALWPLRMPKCLGPECTAKTTPSVLLECRAGNAKWIMPRRKTCWNLLGCLKPANRSQPLVGRSSPYCEDMWRRYCCLTSFFPIVDTCLSCRDTARQNCGGGQMVNFLHPVFSASYMQHNSDLHYKFALRPHLCGSMVDIQSNVWPLKISGEKKEEESR